MFGRGQMVNSSPQRERLGMATPQERRKRQRNRILGVDTMSTKEVINEKDAEIRSAVGRAEELERQLAQQKNETVAWHAMSMEQHKAIACLKARLQRATAALERKVKIEEGSGETSVNDAESVYVDVESKRLAGVCRECEDKAATVVLLPCRHLCLCMDCNEEVAPVPCHICNSFRTGCFQFFLS